MLRPMLFGCTALVAVLVSSTPEAPGRAAPAPAVKEKEKELSPVPSVEARFTDGSVLKFKVLDDKITLETAYGKLVIPLADVYEIEFATRVPDETSRQIAAAIADLGSSTFERREAASKKLERLQRLAYPALLKVEEDKDSEVKKRAARLLDTIRKSVAEELLKVTPHDVIHTKDSRIAGRIAESTFKGETTQFGEVKVRLGDVLTLRSLTHKKEALAVAAMPGPATLAAHQGQVGQTFVFTVTGNLLAGAVWGTDFYTLDTALAAAAVHAGVLQPGKTGNVKVKIHGPRANFDGTMKNGVQSHPFGQYPGYEILKK